LTTFDFDRKYLQKRTAQLKSEKHLINHISSPIGRTKFGELWSTNKKVIGTHVDPPKWFFYERLLFRPLRVVAPSIFYTPYNPLNCISSRFPGAGRPQVGLCPIFLVLFIFLTRHRISELRRPIAAKLDQHMRQLFNASPKIRGSSPKKFGAKNMQNFDRFYTTSHFDREYLRNETTYQKSERHVISSDSSRVQPNRSGELWSTIHKVVHVSLDPPK